MRERDSEVFVFAKWVCDSLLKSVSSFEFHVKYLDEWDTSQSSICQDGQNYPWSFLAPCLSSWSFSGGFEGESVKHGDIHLSAFCSLGKSIWSVQIWIFCVSFPVGHLLLKHIALPCLFLPDSFVDWQTCGGMKVKRGFIGNPEVSPSGCVLTICPDVTPASVTVMQVPLPTAGTTPPSILLIKALFLDLLSCGMLLVALALHRGYHFHFGMSSKPSWCCVFCCFPSCSHLHSMW